MRSQQWYLGILWPPGGSLGHSPQKPPKPVRFGNSKANLKRGGMCPWGALRLCFLALPAHFSFFIKTSSSGKIMSDFEVGERPPVRNLVHPRVTRFCRGLHLPLSLNCLVTLQVGENWWQSKWVSFTEMQTHFFWWRYSQLLPYGYWLALHLFVNSLGFPLL